MKKQKNKNQDPDMPLGEVTIVKDFLPPPHELVFPKNTQKVTISLNQNSINFFKRQAAKNQTKYQKMIRSVLDHYAAHYHEKTK